MDFDNYLKVFNICFIEFFRWHVRTKENIARVRRDEAQAAEEEKERLQRVHKAEQEARLNFLRKQAHKSSNDESSDSEESTTKLPEERQENNVFEDLKTDDEIQQRLSQKHHINFFAEVEDGTNKIKKPNKEHEKEIKEEKEKYEKQIGYLTYLGQDTNEALGKKNWYDVLPERITGNTQLPFVKDTYDKLIIKDIEGNVKPKKIYEELQNRWKSDNDPLNVIKFHLKNDVKKPIADTSTPSTFNKSENIKIDPLEYKSIFPKKKKKERKSSKDKKSKKHKKKKKKQHDYYEKKEDQKRANLEKLRQDRLKREQEEKNRADALIARITGKPTVDNSKSTTTPSSTRVIKQKYNSQFNPELAKQNYETF